MFKIGARIHIIDGANSSDNYGTVLESGKKWTRVLWDSGIYSTGRGSNFFTSELELTVPTLKQRMKELKEV